jgi:hypothetical protein
MTCSPGRCSCHWRRSIRWRRSLPSTPPHPRTRRARCTAESRCTRRMRRRSRRMRRSNSDLRRSGSGHSSRNTRCTWQRSRRLHRCLTWPRSQTRPKRSAWQEEPVRGEVSCLKSSLAVEGGAAQQAACRRQVARIIGTISRDDSFDDRTPRRARLEPKHLHGNRPYFVTWWLLLRRWVRCTPAEQTAHARESAPHAALPGVGLSRWASNRCSPPRRRHRCTPHRFRSGRTGHCSTATARCSCHPRGRTPAAAWRCSARTRTSRRA